MVAREASCAADVNADNTRARALILLFILTVVLLNVAGIILNRPSLTAVRKAPLQRIRTALDRRRDPIDHGPRATRSARGKTGDEQQQQQHDHHRGSPEKFHAHVLASEAPPPCHTA